jgi:hypothetical protein
MVMMRSMIRTAVSVGALAMLAACGSDAGTGVRASATGSFTLTSVNAQPLPFPESSNGAVVKITQGQLVTQADGSFSETVTRSTTPPGGATTTQATTRNGTYSVGNQVIVFTFSAGAGTALGSLTASGVSIQDNNNSFEYTKQ